ncbi:hypothetical protein C8R46DRAFT_1216810 [Mycena filopes]|nr:hypothetical protein C8R46DRAFT_1216810 [Mycena filopes]
MEAAPAALASNERYAVDDSLSTSHLGAAYLVKINRFDASVSNVHVDAIPNEILSKILLMVPIRFCDHPDLWDGGRRLVSRVCRRWASNVASTPAFWSQIYIDQRTILDQLYCWLLKAKASRLTFSLRSLVPAKCPPRFHNNPVRQIRFWDAVGATISPFMPQCERFYITASAAISSNILLHSLSSLDGAAIDLVALCMTTFSMELQRFAQSDGDTAYTCPVLFTGRMRPRHLIFDSTFVAWGPLPLYANVTHLQLENLLEDMAPSVDELFELLPAMPVLQQLHISNVEVVGLDDFTKEPPCLPHVTHLFFALHETSCSCFLSMLQLPALRTLHLEFHAEELVSDFINHCKSVVSEVTTLLLDIQLDSILPLVGVLSMFPKLERLDGRDNLPYFSLAMHAISLHWPDLCPRLANLWIADAINPKLLSTLLRFGRGLHIVSPMDLDTSEVMTIPREAWLNNDNNVVSRSCVTSYNSFGF